MKVVPIRWPSTKELRMLINFIDKGLEVITHPAHGLLSGKIAEQVHSSFRLVNWLETITAIIEHDDEQLSPKQKNCISKIGKPLDFLNNTLPPEKSLQHAKAVFDKVLLKSSWSAMLLSHHLQFLYEDAAKDLDEFKEFLKGMKHFRKVTCALHQVDTKEVERLYQIMIFSDRLSLILCQNEIPLLGRELEINKSIAGKTYFIKELEDGSITVRPWVFERDSFEISVDARLLKEIKFKNEKDFTEALARAAIYFKRWKFSKSERI